MLKWLIFLQTMSEGPGNITKWLTECGQKFEIVKLWQQRIPENIDNYCGLIIMGGIMSANDEDKFPFLSEEIKFIKQWIDTNKPLLGICLGSQLMAKAFGEKVYKGEEPEIGWHPIQFTNEGSTDPMFQHLSPETIVFQWHYDTFDLPTSGVLLASSQKYKNQAYRIVKNAYAVQFHPEMDEELINRWVKIHHKKLVQLNPDLPQKILTDTKLYLNRLEKFGKHIIKTLCDRIK